jgi:hypothetical protein
MLLEMMRRCHIMVGDFDTSRTLPKRGRALGGWGSWLVFIIGLLGRGMRLAGRWV